MVGIGLPLLLLLLLLPPPVLDLSKLPSAAVMSERGPSASLYGEAYGAGYGWLIVYGILRHL